MEEKLKLSEILSFLKSNESSNCVKEAEAILLSKRLILCGVKSCTETKIELNASCLQTSATKSTPHSISGYLNKEGKEWKIKSFSCSCKAGASESCKHCVAVMLLCHEQDMTTFEVLSCTDMECYWKKNKGQYINEVALPLQDFCHRRPVPKSRYKLSEEEKQNLRSDIMNLLPHSSYAKLKKRYVAWKEEGHVSLLRPHNTSIAAERDFVSVVEELLGKQCEPRIDYSMQFLDVGIMQYYMENVSVTKDAAKEIAIATIDQRNQLWIAEKKKRITGSICYELFTYSKNKSSNWTQKVQRLYGSTFSGNMYTTYGLTYEKEAFERYKESSPDSVMKSGFIIHPEYPFLGYSPDGLVVSNAEMKLLEIKCPFQGMSKTAIELVEYLDYHN